MPDKTLRQAVIKLAHAKPEIREHLLPLLKEGSGKVKRAYGRDLWEMLPELLSEEAGGEDASGSDFEVTGTLQRATEMFEGEVYEVLEDWELWGGDLKGRYDIEDVFEDAPYLFIRSQKDGTGARTYIAAGWDDFFEGGRKTVKELHQLFEKKLRRAYEKFNNELSEAVYDNMARDNPSYGYREGSGKETTMSQLRKDLLRLAHDKPELRGDLLPLLKKQARGGITLRSVS
jgi:hypothetical protein